MTHVAETTPYPWPYDGATTDELDPDRFAVVVCGAQTHWVAMVDDPAALADALAVVDKLRAAGVLVIWVRTGASTLGARPIDRTLPVVGSDDWQLCAEVQPGDLVVDTPGHDAFAVLWIETELRSRAIDRLVLAGVGTETTVSGTNRSANDRGFECLTLTDAVVHHEAVTGEASLSSICMSGGIFGALGTSPNLLAALAGP